MTTRTNTRARRSPQGARAALPSLPGPDSSTAESIDAFRRILRALRLAARETLSAAGLSAAQLFVLSALANDDGVSMSQLADRTMTDRSSVAAVVDRLVDGKLVVRGVSGVDRRRAAVSITAKGRGVLRTAPPAPTRALMNGLQALPATTRRRLATDLSALTRAMGIDAGAAGMFFDDVDPARRSAARRKVKP